MTEKMQDDKFTAVDLFCGAGGVSQGMIESNRVKILVAINHSKEAIEAHKKNNPDIVHLTEDIKDYERILPYLPRKVNILWASAECTNYSNAKGGQSRDPDSRSLPEYLPEYVSHCNPDYFIVENVKEFMEWGPLVPKKKDGKVQYDKKGRPIMHPGKLYRGTLFRKWINKVCVLGYEYQHQLLNSADYGAYTSRTRYFGVFAKPGLIISFPTPTHAKKPGMFGEKKWKACKEKIDFDNEGTSIFGREYNKNIPKHLRRPLADNTMARIAYGLQKYHLEDFIAKAFNTKHNVSSIDEPLHTIDTNDRHAKIKVEKVYFVSKQQFGKDQVSSVDEPLHAIVTKGRQQIITCDKAFFISKAYGFKNRKPSNTCSSVDEPLHAITTIPGQYLIECEKGFYIIKQQGQKKGEKPTNGVSSVEDPLHTIMTANRHAVIEANNRHFIAKKQGNKYNVASIDVPLYTIVTKEHGSVVTVKGYFITQAFHNSDKTVSNIDDPLGTIVTKDEKTVITVDKVNFISKKNSGKHQVQSVDEPLHTILTSGTDKAVITINLDNKIDKAIYQEKTKFFKKYLPDYDSDFLCLLISDIKMRYLISYELSDITGFKKGTYLGSSETVRKKHIGNAVPPIIPNVMMEELWNVNVTNINVA